MTPADLLRRPESLAGCAVAREHFDLLSRSMRIFVLPDPDRQPPSRCDLVVDITVAMDDAAERQTPSLGVGLG